MMRLRGSWSGAVGILIAAGAIFGLLWPAGASARTWIYWDNYDAKTDQTVISRAWLDGTHVEPRVVSGIPGQLGGLAQLGDRLIWSTNLQDDRYARTIGRAALDGSALEQVVSTAVPGPSGMVELDGRLLVSSVNNPIMSIDLAGATTTKVVVRNAHWPIGLAISGSLLFWAHGDEGYESSIGRARVDGSRVDNHFITGLGMTGAVAATRRHLYWTDSNGSYTGIAIGRARLDGTGVRRTFIRTGRADPFGLAVSGRYIFWSTSGGWVSRANLNGTHVRRHFIRGVRPSVLAVVKAP